MRPAAPPRRRPRVVGVIIVLLVIGALIAGFASLSLDDGKSDPIKITGAGEVQQLFGGIQQKDGTLGNPDAPVTIDVFNDLSCDPCSDWQLDVIPKLVNDYVRPDKAQLTYRHFSMGERDSSAADYGSLAAAQQDYEWQYVELFFINQDEAKRVGITDEFQSDLANAVLEMDADQWRKDFTAPEVQARIDSDNKVAADLLLPAQPAVIVTGPGGEKKLVASPSYEDIVGAIDEVS
jgi:protein-disulfide isomerase